MPLESRRVISPLAKPQVSGCLPSLRAEENATSLSTVWRPSITSPSADCNCRRWVMAEQIRARTLRVGAFVEFNFTGAARIVYDAEYEGCPTERFDTPRSPIRLAFDSVSKLWHLAGETECRR